jgi:glycine/D-amino acid oxidase-like deaminating enzyme
MQYAPAVLLRFKPCQPLPRHILSAPDLEIRQQPDGTLLVAEDMPANGPAGLRHLGNTVAQRIAQTFATDTQPQLHSIEIGNRPYPLGGLPFVAALPQASGVFAALAHPGVALAPYVALTCADLVLGNDE